jgi:GT2 family glycosyltransferase
MSSMCTVIVPIYEAAEVTRACVRAVLEHTDPSVPIVLADDASPDQELAAWLQSQARGNASRVRYLRQARNLGFIGNCNTVMSQVDGDVLLLNSDTEVTPGWLPAMLRVAQSDPKVASVTPFSNNAEICSFPSVCQARAVPHDHQRYASVFSQAEPACHELPTAVGFCMWMARSALALIGDFDGATFGRGYGEENDWCMRARGFGFRHLLATRAYVIHKGGASFGPLGEKPGGEALLRLSARYPAYLREIADFIERDSLKDTRDQLCTQLRQRGIEP